MKHVVRLIGSSLGIFLLLSLGVVLAASAGWLQPQPASVAVPSPAVRASATAAPSAATASASSPAPGRSPHTGGGQVAPSTIAACPRATAATHRSIANRSGEAETRWNLALALLAEGKLDQAVACMEQTTAYERSVQHPRLAQHQALLNHIHEAARGRFSDCEQALRQVYSRLRRGSMKQRGLSVTCSL